MTWLLWTSLLGLTLSASTLGVSFYVHWSWRYQIKWLGIVAEVALATTILFGGGTGLAALLGHMPR